MTEDIKELLQKICARETASYPVIEMAISAAYNKKCCGGSLFGVK